MRNLFAKNINKLAKDNTNFRSVLQTGAHSQVVAMSIPVGGDIGEETHEHTDQILIFVEGACEAILDGESKNVGEQDVVFVPAGTRHNFKNIGDNDLKLISVYAPAEHADGTIHATKVDAQQAESQEHASIDK